ncbi:Fur family transcriptional regulator [Carboxylicivirga sp. M1479]|uniref:Fur family transcriptional regulator n=1 Tax=Carboxylicivirga sp. M1479 TaxID=2594476 RepID=UPI00117892C9|nr:transcriptional repressor [Carboxylicivirga sp. M1479]TRX66369.1 transcriptional repressor [Carboxylicivirga sp. M1479]
MSGQEKTKQYLRARKLKATPIRVELMQLFKDNGAALPYSDIQKNLSSYDRVTLYRTINALIDNGIVHKASTSGDEVYYALCSPECSNQCHHHEHIHFKCTKCNEVSCVQAQQSFEINIPGYQIDELSIEVKGMCKKCLV